MVGRQTSQKKSRNRLDTIFVGSLTSDGVMKCILQDGVRKRLTLLCKTHKNRCYYRYKNHTKSVFFYILPSVPLLLENGVEVVQYNLPFHPSSSTVHHSPYAIFHPFHPIRKQNIFCSVQPLCQIGFLIKWTPIRAITIPIPLFPPPLQIA